MPQRQLNMVNDVDDMVDVGSTPGIEPGHQHSECQRIKGADLGLGNVEEDVGGAVMPTASAGWDSTSICGSSLPETLSSLGL